MTAQVVVVGSLNDDLVVSVQRLPLPGETVLADGMHHHPGGKGLNQAVAAARMGASVRLVGAVGDDDAGARLRQLLDVEGIEDGLRTVDGSPTGTALIEVDAHGENRIVVVPGANARLDVTDVPATGSPAVVIAQAEIPLDCVRAAMQWARAAGAVSILNPSPARAIPDDVLAAVDLLVVNEHEAALLSDVSVTDEEGAVAAARSLVRRGVRAAVVTRGAEGAAWYSLEDGEGSAAAFPVTAVDTVGAGDAFCGALAAATAYGAALGTAVQWAGAAGALAATRHGAVPSLPRRTEVETLVGEPLA